MAYTNDPVISGVYSDINKQEKNKGHINDYI